MGVANADEWAQSSPSPEASISSASKGFPRGRFQRWGQPPRGRLPLDWCYGETVVSKTSVRFAAFPLLTCTNAGTKVLPMLVRPS